MVVALRAKHRDAFKDSDKAATCFPQMMTIDCFLLRGGSPKHKYIYVNISIYMSKGSLYRVVVYGQPPLCVSATVATLAGAYPQHYSVSGLRST